VDDAVDRARERIEGAAEGRTDSAAVDAALERVEGDLLSERHARVDDLALLVDLVTAGWRSVEHRLIKIESSLDQRSGAVVYRMEERRPSDSQAG
jgi:hypothetical protein